MKFIIGLIASMSYQDAVLSGLTLGIAIDFAIAILFWAFS